MHEIITIYLIISLYLCIGYVIHSSCIREIYKDSYYSKVYNSLSDNSKKIIMVILMIIWLPVTIGELITMLVKWIAENYEK